MAENFQEILATRRFGKHQCQYSPCVVRSRFMQNFQSFINIYTKCVHKFYELVPYKNFSLYGTYPHCLRKASNSNLLASSVTVPADLYIYH